MAAKRAAPVPRGFFASKYGTRKPPPKLKRAGSSGSVNGIALSAEERQADIAAWIQAKKPAAGWAFDAPPNSFGLALGKTASQELKNFTAAFDGLAADSAEGQVLRVEAFVAADPSGEPVPKARDPCSQITHLLVPWRCLFR